MKKYLAPSILSADFLQLGKQVQQVEAGGADFVHCDIMDGQFVPNLTFGPLVVKAVKRITSLPLDVHLMIKNPDALIPTFIESGASFVTVHVEEVVHLHRCVQHIRNLKGYPGIALNPSTPFYAVEETLEYVDLVLAMSVNPGFGGQKFITSTLKKIEKIADFREKNGLAYLIEIDGGINQDTIKAASDAGVDVFVIGSAVFDTADVEETVKMYKILLNKKN
jgi:ribulose-phosphate 3-epimerase